MQLAFAAARVARENVQNKLRAIDHAAFRGLFDVSLLHGREIAVENNQRRFVGRRFGTNLVEFAAPDQGGRVGRVAHLVDRAGDFCAGAACQLDELGQGFPALFARRNSGNAARTFPGHADQQSAFRGGSLMLCLHRLDGAGVIVPILGSVLAVTVHGGELLHIRIIRRWLPHCDRHWDFRRDVGSVDVRRN